MDRFFYQILLIQKKNIIVYEYINEKLVRIGRIKDRYFFQDHHFLISTITYILQLIPDYIEEDYDVNVIEILRHTFQSFTKNIGVMYGFVYWILFGITISFCFGYIILFHKYTNTLFYILQLILLLVLTVFCINSSLYIKNDYEELPQNTTVNKNIFRGEEGVINTTEYSYNNQDEIETLSDLLNKDYNIGHNYIQKHFPSLKIECIPDNIEIFNDYDSNRISFVL